MSRYISTTQLTFEPRGRVFPSPADWREQIVYQLLIDRFDDGQDRPLYDPSNMHRGEIDAENGQRFQGGTLRAIIRRLDYLRDMGVTAVWTSPPLKNRQGDPHTYHGYGAMDFLDVDPRFGTIADLRALSDALHDRGMYLIMDIVMDHAGDVWAYRDDRHPVFDRGQSFDFGWWRANDGRPVTKTPGPDDAIWPLELQMPEAFLRQGRMADIERARGAEATDGDFLSLKCFDLSRDDVADAIIAVYKYWIAVADVDGFRIDAARHIRPSHLRRFTNAIREYARRIGKMNFVQIGELPHGGEESRRYIASNAPLASEKNEAHYPLLDAVLDFDLLWIGGDVFSEKVAPAKLSERWRFLDRYHRDPSLATQCYWTFVENHDFGAGGIRRLLAGVGERDAEAFALRSMAFLLMGSGVPILYYGTEQGFNGDSRRPTNGKDQAREHGSGDHCIREAMFGGTWGGFQSQGAHFFNARHPIYRGIRRLCDIRAEFPALRFGRTIARDAAPGILEFGRRLDEQELAIIINLTTQPWSGPVAAPSRGDLRRLWHPAGVERTAVGIQLQLPPLGFEIIANDR